MKYIALLLLALYQKLLSPIMVVLFGKGCRFTPTCSNYAKQAFSSFGFKHGLILSVIRISKCHPFSKSEYYDPIPSKIT